jgi:cell wall-associated NlpC family hydrolase
MSPALMMLLVGMVAGLLLVISPTGTGSADAMTLRKAHRVVHVAASRKGSPYRWGAEGPHRFDCSGLTYWAFHRVGKYLPRVSRSQYRFTRHIRRAHRRRGDLVFFHRGPRARSVYHVGIYAGRGMIWHAPHPGARVRKEHIWTRKVWYGRVR